MHRKFITLAADAAASEMAAIVRGPIIRTYRHSPQQMRILHVIPSLVARVGGPVKVAVEMCCEIAQLGERVAIYMADLDGSGRLDLSNGESLRNWRSSSQIALI